MTVQDLIARADKIDRRLGPISGQDADAIARELRAASRLVAAASDLLDSAAVGLAWLEDMLEEIYEAHCILNDDLSPQKETLDEDVKDDVANLEEVIANLKLGIAKATGGTP